MTLAAAATGGQTGTGPVAVSVRGLSRRFGDVVATDGVDLDIAQGEMFGLLGPNGAGKTTLVRQLVGLLRPDTGSVTLLTGGRPAGQVVAYLPQQDVALAELPVALAVQTTGRLRGMSRAAARAETGDLLGELGLEGLADRPLVRLSGGERRLAALAATLIGQRPVLVLDEPTTGLDPVARRAVWAALAHRRSEGATVLLVTHNVLEAETVLDRVAVLDRGRVVACDSPGRLKALVDDSLRLELVWRGEAPAELAAVRSQATVSGRRWTLRLPADDARALLTRVSGGPLLAALDDFTLSTPTLEDVYLALGGRARDLERG